MNEITNQQMINEMLTMQRALDEAIYKEHGCEFDEEKCLLAMIDEIGEFNHEIKSTWCWWKKSQKEMGKEKTLEELVDIWHFALSYVYNHFDRVKPNYKFVCYMFDDEEIQKYKNSLLSILYRKLLNNEYYKLENLCAIGLKFGFTLEDVYNAYKKKNQVNYERLANNY